MADVTAVRVLRSSRPLPLGKPAGEALPALVRLPKALRTHPAAIAVTVPRPGDRAVRHGVRNRQHRARNSAVCGRGRPLASGGGVRVWSGSPRPTGRDTARRPRFTSHAHSIFVTADSCRLWLKPGN